MAEINIPKPTKSVTFPSALLDPALKNEEYHKTCCQAIWWNNNNLANNPYGNTFRSTWIENRLMARGTQSNIPFAARPPAKNDHTKNPVLRHIDFSTVNEMVKYCDIFVSMLEENDYDVQAIAINPAAATAREEIKSMAQAFLKLRPTFEKMNQQAGMDIAPTNPMEAEASKGAYGGYDFDFEDAQELEVFFQIGFKLLQELQVEIANEVVMNESQWPDLRKKLCEDIRDCGFVAVGNEVDTNNRIRSVYYDVINAGWEDFRGHYLDHMCKFWVLEVKTGGAIMAESGGEISFGQMLELARRSEGRYGNPQMPTMTSGNNWGYINTDYPQQGMFWDSWKFPVLTCKWEDWDVWKYRSITRTDDGQQESYSPVDFNYKPKNGNIYKDGDVEKEIKIHNSHIHCYRTCKWLIGSDIVYRWGKEPFCPRDPRDTRFALSPVKIYRAAGNPMSQRLTPIAKMAQNAWYKFQNEVAKAKPHAAKINLAAMDNLTTIDGKKLTRYHILELYNEDGTVLYSDKGAMDDMGITRRPSPIEPIDNVDIAAMQRWVDVINFCSLRMQQESGMTQADQLSPEVSATAIDAGQVSTSHSIKQYVDALLKIGEELAIDTVGKLQELVRQGHYLGYQSSIGKSLLKNVPITEDVTVFTYGIKVVKKPTGQQRNDLKLNIQKQFSSPTDPTQSSLYANQLLYLTQLIDEGTNLKLVALIAGAYHRQNMKRLEAQQMATIKANTESQQQIAQTAAQSTLETEKGLSQIRINEYREKIAADIELEKVKTKLKTENQAIINEQKSANKQNETILKATIGA